MCFMQWFRVQPPSILWGLHPQSLKVLCFQPVDRKREWGPHMWVFMSRAWRWTPPSSRLHPVRWLHLPESGGEIGNLVVCPRWTETDMRRAGQSAPLSLTQTGCLNMVGMLWLCANIHWQWIWDHVLSKISRENRYLPLLWLLLMSYHKGVPSILGDREVLWWENCAIYPSLWENLLL